MNDSNLPRVYGDEDIGRILKRATELQHREPSAPAAGVTLSELEEIAAEAGIDPRYLRRAARELDSGTGESTFWTAVVGDRLTIVREATLEGELTEEGFERIAVAVQSQSKEHGQPSLLGRTLTWRAETANKSRTIQLVVASRDGRTEVRVEENLTQLAAGLFAGITSGFGLGVGLGVGLPIGLEVLGSVFFATAAPVGMVALSYGAARLIYRAVVKRRSVSMDQLFERVLQEARQCIPVPGVVEREDGLASLPPA